MTPAQISALADQLYSADQNRTKADLPTAVHPEMSLADAYATQAAFMSRRISDDGVTRIGWKVGFTSAALQQQMGTDRPGRGTVLSDMLWANGVEVGPGRLVEPRVEAEIAFVMKTPLTGADASAENVLAATDYVAPALEILTARLVQTDPATGKPRSAVDAIASNIACAGIVIGEPHHHVSAFDLRGLETRLLYNGDVAERGHGAAVLGDPVASVLWLVHHLAQFGEGLPAGAIVMSGSLIRPVSVLPRSTVEADFGDFGTVRATLG